MSFEEAWNVVKFSPQTTSQMGTGLRNRKIDAMPKPAEGEVDGLNQKTETNQSSYKQRLNDAAGIEPPVEPTTSIPPKKESTTPGLDNLAGQPATPGLDALSNEKTGTPGLNRLREDMGQARTNVTDFMRKPGEPEPQRVKTGILGGIGDRFGALRSGKLPTAANAAEYQQTNLNMTPEEQAGYRGNQDQDQANRKITAANRRKMKALGTGGSPEGRGQLRTLANPESQRTLDTASSGYQDPFNVTDDIRAEGDGTSNPPQENVTVNKPAGNKLGDWKNQALGGTDSGGIKIPGWRGLVPGKDISETSTTNPDGSIKTTRNESVNNAAKTFGRTLGLSGAVAGVGAATEYGANKLVQGAANVGNRFLRSDTEYEMEMNMILAKHYEYRGDLMSIREQNTTGAIRDAFR